MLNAGSSFFAANCSGWDDRQTSDLFSSAERREDQSNAEGERFPRSMSSKLISVAEQRGLGGRLSTVKSVNVFCGELTGAAG